MDLEKNAFRAGYMRGRYNALATGWEIPSTRHDVDKEWREYRSQPIQLELDLGEPTPRNLQPQE